MGSLSKKVPYPRDNLRLAVKVTVNLRSSFACMEPTLSTRNRQTKFYLLTHYFTYSPKFFHQFVVLPIRQSFPLYGICLYIHSYTQTRILSHFNIINVYDFRVFLY